MILSIDKYTCPEYLVKPYHYNNIKWNGESVADNGWFYFDACGHLIHTDWKVGMMAIVVDPDILDVFTAEKNDDYEDYGFVKAYGKWYRLE